MYRAKHKSNIEQQLYEWYNERIQLTSIIYTGVLAYQIKLS